MKKNLSVYERAIAELQQAITEAKRRNLPEPESAALATADAEGNPSVRMVYVLGVDERGLLMFVNMRSGKGIQLQQNPRASVCFFWPDMQFQAITDGAVSILSESESDAYWKKRPRASQLGALASEQSEALKDPKHLKRNLAVYQKLFAFDEAARPDNWRAVRVQPVRMEFWGTGWHRLHPRVKYEIAPDGDWVEILENP